MDKIGPLLQIEKLSKHFGKGENVLDSLSFDLLKGETVAVIGNSGGGKTTLLNLIAGFEYPSSGVIKKNGEAISNSAFVLPVKKRKVGIIFQDYALFPHLSVEQNIRYGKDKKSGDAFLNLLVELTGIGNLLKRFPSEISGGEKQRVALVRSLLAKPDVLLMDEPFSSIDIVNREAMRHELKTILTETQTSTLLVTHDFHDVLALAKRVVVLKDGECLQQGSVEEVYNQPENIFTARMFGVCNEVKGKWKDNDFETSFGTISNARNLPGNESSLFIRPSQFKISNEINSLKGIVTDIHSQGSYFEYSVKTEEEIIQLFSDSREVQKGSEISFGIKSHED